MGSAPPQDAPPPDDQDIVDADAGFKAGPPAVSLCGFSLTIPKLYFNLKLNLSIPWPPTFNLYLGFKLNCDLDNPLDITGGIGPGGGRKSNKDKTPDEDGVN